MIINYLFMSLITVWVAYAIYTVVKNKRKGISSCGGKCSSCALDCNSSKISKMEFVRK